MIIFVGRYSFSVSWGASNYLYSLEKSVVATAKEVSSVSEVSEFDEVAVGPSWIIYVYPETKHALLDLPDAAVL